MSYIDSEQKSSRKRMIGLGVVVAAHVVLGILIQLGMARDIVKLVKDPVEAVLLEEIKPPKPPPPPPPKPAAPPPPPQMQSNIVESTPNPNSTTAQSEVKPAAPAAPIGAPTSTSAALSAGGNCAKPEYPRESLRAGETGTSRIRFVVEANGRVSSASIERSSGSRRLDQAAMAALSLCTFTPGTQAGKPVRSETTINYVWRID